MGVVYRAQDGALHREVALKTMMVAVASPGSETDHARFMREARAAGSLQHHNIVTIFDLGEDAGTPFLAMELLHGTDLRRRLLSGNLPTLPERLAWLAQVCDGLAFAHARGLIHRDIKPANLFVCDDNTVKILDFGIAHPAGSTRSRAESLYGTSGYMSPEQAEAREELDGRSDLFSVGVVLYELTFRRSPFPAGTATAADRAVVATTPAAQPLYDALLPPELATLLRRSLAKERSQRFPDAAAMAGALRRAAEKVGGGGSLIEQRIEAARHDGRLQDGADPLSRPIAITAPVRTSSAPRRPTPGAGATHRTPWLMFLILAAIALLIAIWPRGADMSEYLAPIRRGHPPRRVSASPKALPLPNTAEAEPTDDEALDGAADERIDPNESADDDHAEVSDTDATAAVADEAGRIDLQTVPRAELIDARSVTSGETIRFQRATPLEFTLAPGEWVLRIGHIKLAEPVEIHVTVEAGARTVVHSALPLVSRRDDGSNRSKGLRALPSTRDRRPTAPGR